jgi:hypothetical protein
MIYAITDESQVSIIDRLATEELDRLQAERLQTMIKQTRTVQLRSKQGELIDTIFVDYTEGEELTEEQIEEEFTQWCVNAGAPAAEINWFDGKLYPYPS